MELETPVADSGLDGGNAGGEQSTPVVAPEKSGLSLSESLAKAASTVRERTEEPSPARDKPSGKDPNTAFEKSTQTDAGSPPVQAGSQEEAMAPSILEAPKHWPQKQRDAFAKLTDPALQKEWLDHTKHLEGEFTRKSQEHAEHRKFAEQARELFTPEQRETLRQQGANEIAAIKWWSELDTFSRKNPAGYAKWFMQQTGLTPQQLFPELGTAPAPQQSQSDEWVDPETLKLREELGSVKSQFQTFLQQQEQQRVDAQRAQQAADSRRQEELLNSLNASIQKFAETKDESGNALYPHFAEVEERMAWEFNHNPAISQIADRDEMLKAAYDLAVWANPNTRQALISAQTAQAQAEAQKRAAAEKAKAAQTLKPRVGSNAGAQAAPPSDLRSLIRDAAGRAKG